MLKTGPSCTCTIVVLNAAVLQAAVHSQLVGTRLSGGSVASSSCRHAQKNLTFI